jgi:hypothetical protein
LLIYPLCRRSSALQLLKEAALELREGLENGTGTANYFRKGFLGYPNGGASERDQGDWFVCVVKVRIRKWGHAFFAKFLAHSKNLTPAAMVDAGEIVTKIDFEIGG